MNRRIPPTRIALSPQERAAVAQARAALALAVPLLRDADLRRSLHGALCQAERALLLADATPLRAERREDER